MQTQCQKEQASIPFHSISPYKCRLESTELPSAWSSYQKLKEISISGCGLEGSLPTSWGSLARLKRLDLSENHLSGVLPGQWSGMDHLETLDMSCRERRPQGKGLSGSLPSEWQFMERLRELDLWNQAITGMQSTRHVLVFP